MPAALRDGVCATHPQPHLWGSGDPGERLAAQRLCLSCPALAPCRAWALSLRTADDLVTVLGGQTPHERRLARRDRQRQLSAATAARLPLPPGRACPTGQIPEGGVTIRAT
jgi:hypothetical protein